MTTQPRELPDHHPADMVDRVLALVDAHYVLPERVASLQQRLTARVATGAYADLEQDALAAAVTADLEAVTGDRHLRLVHHPEVMPADQDDDVRDDAEMAAQAAAAAYGIARVERLADGIGVLALAPAMFSPWLAADAMAAAFTEMAGSSALLLDLRGCLGGDPEMVAFVCTYLFGREAVHLNDMVERGDRELRQFWTLPYVPGMRLGPDVPVYVVIGPATFSGGEELAYDLQQLGRAVVVGEPSRGGAHPRRGFRLTDHLEAHIPVARPVNPRSGTSWEGVGVQPDVQLEAARALDEAARLARAGLPEPPRR